MSDTTLKRKDDREVLEGDREKLVQTDDGDSVRVPLRDRISKKLLEKLEDGGEGERTVNIWRAANEDRAEWLDRYQEYTDRVDEFHDSAYEAKEEWQADEQTPVTFIQCKTLYSRLFQAVLGMDPPFTVRARQDANATRTLKIQDLMRYAVKDWANEETGVEEEVQLWVWKYVTGGSSVLKTRWDRKYTRFVDIVEEPVVVGQIETRDPSSGNPLSIPQTEIQEVEKRVTREIFNGPKWEWIPIEDFVVVGHRDPQKADDVIHADRLTASDLWSLADQGIFREESVRKIIDHGESTQLGHINSSIKQQEAFNAGESSPDKDYDSKRYSILERYARIDVDGSGIASDVVLWVHEETKEIVRATYLYRMNPTGLRPFHKADMHLRRGLNYGAGLPELMNTLQTKIDAMSNIKQDFGLLSSIPFGFYRPTSSTSEEKLKIEPGTLFPLDNPQTDVSFPQFGNRSVFAANEEQAARQDVERLTSLSDLSLGLMNGSQGATRTATGTRALLGESNSNLDIFLRPLMRGFKRALQYTFTQMQMRVQPGFEFRLTGDDGTPYSQVINDPSTELRGMYDFEIEPNSSNSNKQVQIEQANNIVQLASNPLNLQLGIVTPLEFYEAQKHLLQVLGTRDIGRFLRKPEGIVRVFTPIEVANRVLQGIDTPMTPEQDLQGFVELFDLIMKDDEVLGQYDSEDLIRLKNKASEAQQMLAALKQQQAQQANQQQVQMNAALGSRPTALATQLPGTGSEG